MKKSTKQVRNKKSGVRGWKLSHIEKEYGYSTTGVEPIITEWAYMYNDNEVKKVQVKITP